MSTIKILQADYEEMQEKISFLEKQCEKQARIIDCILGCLEIILESKK